MKLSYGKETNLFYWLFIATLGFGDYLMEKFTTMPYLAFGGFCYAISIVIMTLLNRKDDFLAKSVHQKTADMKEKIFLSGMFIDSGLKEESSDEVYIRLMSLDRKIIRLISSVILSGFIAFISLKFFVKSGTINFLLSINVLMIVNSSIVGHLFLPLLLNILLVTFIYLKTVKSLDPKFIIYLLLYFSTCIMIRVIKENRFELNKKVKTLKFWTTSILKVIIPFCLLNVFFWKVIDLKKSGKTDKREKIKVAKNIPKKVQKNLRNKKPIGKLKLKGKNRVTGESIKQIKETLEYSDGIFSIAKNMELGQNFSEMLRKMSGGISSRSRKMESDMKTLEEMLNSRPRSGFTKEDLRKINDLFSEIEQNANSYGSELKSAQMQIAKEADVPVQKVEEFMRLENTNKDLVKQLGELKNEILKLDKTKLEKIKKLKKDGVLHAGDHVESNQARNELSSSDDKIIDNVKSIKKKLWNFDFKKIIEKLTKYFKYLAYFLVFLVVARFIYKYFSRPKPEDIKEFGPEEEILEEMKDMYKKLKKKKLSPKDEIIAYYNFIYDIIMNTPVFNNMNMPPTSLYKKLKRSFAKLDRPMFKINEIFTKMFYGDLDITRKHLSIFRKSIKSVLNFYKVR